MPTPTSSSGGHLSDGESADVPQAAWPSSAQAIAPHPLADPVTDAHDRPLPPIAVHAFKQMPYAQPWAKVNYALPYAYGAWSAGLAWRAAQPAMQLAGGIPSALGDSPALLDASGLAFSAVPLLIDMGIAIRDTVNTARDYRAATGKMADAREGRDAFVASPSKVKDVTSAVFGARQGDEPVDVEPVGLSPAGQYARYHHAAQDARLNGELMFRRVPLALRDGPNQVGNLAIAFATRGPDLRFAPTDAFTGATHTVVGIAGPSLSLVSGALHAAQGAVEIHMSRRALRRAREAEARVDGIAMAPAGEVPQANLDQIVEKAAPEDQVGSVAKRDRGKAALDRLPEQERMRLAGVYGVINANFVDNQKLAADWAKVERGFAAVRTSYGLTQVLIAAATISVAIVIGVSTLGIGLGAASLAMAAVYFGFVAAKYIFAQVRNARLVREDRAAREQAEDATRGKSVDDVERAMAERPELKQNKFLCAWLLTMHLTDRSDEPAGLAPEERRLHPAYVRRKLATRYLLASGMDRHAVRAVKTLAIEGRDLSIEAAFSLVTRQLVKDGARVPEAAATGGWRRILFARDATPKPPVPAAE